MNIYQRKLKWKIFLLIIAVVISIGSLYYTNELVKKLSEEETKKVELWAEATRQIGSDEQIDNFSFLLQVIQNNNTVPVILTDSSDNINFLQKP